MLKFTRRSSQTAGLPPGTMIHIGEKKIEQARVTIIDFDEANFEERVAETIEDTFPLKDTPNVSWVNVDGLHEVDVIEGIGRHFGLHPLLLEDVVNTDQHPKVEEFDGCLFIVLKMLYYDDEADEIDAEQVSIILGSNFVISFQEGAGDVFNPVRERLRNGKSRIRRLGADHLAYALIDAVIDNYFLLVEQLGDRTEYLETELEKGPTPEIWQDIHDLKREVLFLRRFVWPLRDVVSRLTKSESELITDATAVYLRDVYDHTIQVADAAEIFREVIAGMLDTYLSSLSYRMNEVMKVLTIIATIFIPLTFVVGIYGMNFRHMPELEWPWGYPLIMFIMTLLAVMMLAYFRKKRWL